MKKVVPYNAGEIRQTSVGKAMICGHIWWPVEKKNAYHVLKVNAQNEPIGEPIYEWDKTDGQWSLCA